MDSARSALCDDHEKEISESSQSPLTVNYDSVNSLKDTPYFLWIFNSLPYCIFKLIGFLFSDKVFYFETQFGYQIHGKHSCEYVSDLCRLSLLSKLHLKNSKCLTFLLAIFAKFPNTPSALNVTSTDLWTWLITDGTNRLYLSRILIRGIQVF